MICNAAHSAGGPLCQTPALAVDGFTTTVTTAAEMVQAVHCANENGDANGGDTILLGNDVVFTAYEEVADGYNALPRFTAPLTIDGQDHVLSRDINLNCVNDQVLSVDEFRLINNTSTLLIKNISLNNACAWGDGSFQNFDSYGGAILNHSELTVERVIFDNNQAQFGAAIDNTPTGMIAEITNSIIKNSSGLQGAGIMNLGTIEVIRNSAFISNTASNTTGGIELNGNAVINLIENTVFSDNQAGGINVRSSSAQVVRINNSTFAYNSGAIENLGSVMQIDNSIFTGNTTDCYRSNYTGNNNFSDGGDICPGDVGDVTMMDNTLSTDMCVTPLPDGSCLPVFKLQPGSNAIDAATDTPSSTDARGFTANGIRDMGASELIAPFVTPPADIILEATGPATAVTLGTATAVDFNNQSLNATPDTSGPFAVGTHTVTWTATDSHGYNGTATQTVTITDTTPPVVTMNGDNPMQLFVGDVFVDPGATAYDLVDGDITADIVVSGLVFTNGRATWVRGYNVHDNAGNLGYASRMVDINVKRTFTGTMPSGQPGTISFSTQDYDCTFITDPSFLEANNFTPQPPATLSFLDGVVLYSIENCAAGADIEVTVDYVQTIPNDHSGWRHGATWTEFTPNINGNSFSFSIQAPTAQPTQGASTFITDAIGMAGPADLEAPIVTAPADITQEATATLTPVTLGTATVTDNVDLNLTAIADNTGPFSLGTHAITWSATDNNNNTGTDTQSVTLVDTTAPTITLNGSSTLLINVGDIFIDEGATAIDLVGGDLTAQITVSGTVDITTAGTYDLIYTVQDNNGNQSQVTRTVEVNAGGPTSPQVVPAGDYLTWLLMLVLIGGIGFIAVRDTASK
ncbi:immunoglobulin-like domain-containing protein [Marinicella rhabdoformis]|uniref:immunoglobulin-like domain-containing protein n=1 Tax=Marinicella rhabdoformis TaxID=2580566 RepID=UPI0015D05699|nr:immunoglobulin-like domain-containing protein [Marinicella rhabdoformis]